MSKHVIKANVTREIHFFYPLFLSLLRFCKLKPFTKTFFLFIGEVKIKISQYIEKISIILNKNSNVNWATLKVDQFKNFTSTSQNKIQNVIGQLFTLTNSKIPTLISHVDQ